MAGKPGRRISYLMTLAGPEPAGETTADIDREHYVRKQVRPVAQPVLDHLALKFKKVIGDDRQLELF
jgi:DNA polymerase-2